MTGAGPNRRWATGVLTAPRATPLLGPTLASLEAAGFTDLRIFAEPGCPIPPEARPHRLHQAARRGGNLGSFLGALEALLRIEPAAEILAIFQDDIRVARGLRMWLDAHPWPLDAPVVSLFTPRFHAGPTVGWRVRFPGAMQVFGGQALAFRREAAERLLADPLVSQALANSQFHDDAVVSRWATSLGLGIAYHTPSPVQHLGNVSSIYAVGPDRRVVADAVSDISEIADWSPPTRQPGLVGLVGWSTATGLGYQNADLARFLPCDRWLIPPHADLPMLETPFEGCRRIASPPRPHRRFLDDWLDGLDWVLFVERPYLPGLVQAARARQVGVACVPNWEWLHPALDWLPIVDLMLCPTRHTLAHVADWKRRHGFGWDIRSGPWPIDLDRFPHRPREVCRKFLYVDGFGGGGGVYPDGRPTPYNRKGLDLIADSARISPELPIIVASQRNLSGLLPPHVEIVHSIPYNRSLYDSGDLCVQPSRWEGLGLPLLECQAAGLPLVTTGSPPMNEHHPFATIPNLGFETVLIGDGQPIPSARLRATDLVETLRPLVGTDISAASRSARAFIETHHSWPSGGAWLREALVAL